MNKVCKDLRSKNCLAFLRWTIYKYTYDISNKCIDSLYTKLGGLSWMTSSDWIWFKLGSICGGCSKPLPINVSLFYH